MSQLVLWGVLVVVLLLFGAWLVSPMWTDQAQSEVKVTKASPIGSQDSVADNAGSVDVPMTGSESPPESNVDDGPWRWSGGTGILWGLAAALWVLCLFVLTRDDHYFCNDEGDTGPVFGLFLLLVISTPIVVSVAVRRLLVHDEAGFAWLAVLVALAGLMAAALGNTSFCPS